MNIPGTSTDGRYQEKTHRVLLPRELSFIPACLALPLESDRWPPCFRVLNTTLFESWEMIGPYPSWWLFNGLLLILQVLHIIWSYLIMRIAFKALIRGKVRMKMTSFFGAGWEDRYYSIDLLSLSSLVSPVHTSRPSKKHRAPKFSPFRCKRKDLPSSCPLGIIVLK